MNQAMQPIRVFGFSHDMGHHLSWLFLFLHSRNLMIKDEFVMERIAYYNGKIDTPENLTVPFLDRVCFFGDGVYDATASSNGVIYLLDEHVDRLYNSAGLIGIKIPYTKDELKAILNDVVSRVDNKHNIVYFQVTRGTAPRNHAFPDDDVPANLWIMVNPKQFRDFSVPMKLTSMEDKRFLYCNVKTLNLLPSVLAAQKAEVDGCDETVFHRGNIVTECAHSNVSILKDGIIYTHPNDEYILPGIAKNHFFIACNKLGIPVSQTAFTLDDLRNADEVFVTSSSNFCSFADTFEGKPVGCKAPETVKAIQDAVIQEYLNYCGIDSL